MDVVAAPEERPRRFWSGFLERRSVLAVVLIAPAIIYVALVVGVPFGWAIYLSFTNAISGSLTGDWVGFDNFTDVWSDPNFQKALQNTLIVTFTSVALVVVAAAIGWLWIFDSLFSIVNWTLKELHLVGPVCWMFGVEGCGAVNPPQWLGRENMALVAIIVVNAWRILPFAVVIFIAGLASIPTEVEDAAKIDGATGVKKLWYVTLPLQLPIALVAVLFGIVFTAGEFAVVYILTQGGPFNSTQVLPTWAFQVGINSGSLGQGAAISLYLLPLLTLVTICMLFFAKRVQVS
jgi:multiple sugar transport system permease protein